MSSKALFKAYEIDPTSPLVLNMLMLHYFKNQQFKKFFQTLQIANKIMHQNPQVLSLMFVLNSILGVSDSQLLTQSQKTAHISEAINLGQSFRTAVLQNDEYLIELRQT